MAMILEAEGSPAEALVEYRRGANENPIPVGCIAGAVRTAVAAGEVELARRELKRLVPLVVNWPVAGFLLEESRAWVAEAERREDDAVAHFLAAVEACPEALPRAQYRLEAAHVSRDRAELLAAIGEFDRMGAHRDADRARAVARRLGLRPGRPRVKIGELSAREQQVAQLAAAGQTNAEIAAELFLRSRGTPRTRPRERRTTGPLFGRLVSDLRRPPSPITELPARADRSR
jgi:Bacterial regulatory proteins, luxR family